MKEKPVLFSGPMVMAILEGKKTQTRRVLKTQPEQHHWEFSPGHKKTIKLLETDKGLCARISDSIPVGKTGQRKSDEPTWVRCPYGAPGGVLWVRETWAADLSTNELRKKLEDVYVDRSYGPFFRATEENPDIFRKWRPSIHMPRFACRLFLRVKSVRVEQLQDITEEDAMAEGIDNPISTHKVDFSILWDSINGKRKECSYLDNPWVWVVEFERLESYA